MVTADMASSAIDRADFEREYPFAPHYFHSTSGRLHYIDEGPTKAPALLMLHGNPTWSFYYRKLIQGLSRTYRVIAPDHLGCGLSDKPQRAQYTLRGHIDRLTGLVEHLGLTDITLVVHDWGGAIGMGFAVEHPERIGRFVLFNTAAFPSKHMPWQIGLCRIPGFGALAIRGFNAFVRGALATCAVHADRLTPAVRAGYLAPYDTWANRVANLRFVEDIPMSPSHSGYRLLETIGEDLKRFVQHPTLIVWGARDYVFNDHFFNEWRRRLPAAQTHYIPDAGHFVVEDAHERILPLIERFMTEAAA
ncbi:MAG: alpha/beta fold hydrolase [Myxococcota bacterium]